MTPERFSRWLALWRESTAELFPPEAAAALQFKAGRIAESLSLGICFTAGREPLRGAA
jgi:hemoglobin